MTTENNGVFVKPIGETARYPTSKTHKMRCAAQCSIMRTQINSSIINRFAHIFHFASPASPKTTIGINVNVLVCMQPLIWQQEIVITHETVNFSARNRIRRAYHVQNINTYHGHIKNWLDHSHGVATKHLPNSLGWRHAIDTRHLNTPELFLPAAIGLLPHNSMT